MPPASPPLEAARIAAATAGKPETTDNVVKVSFPREERVDIAGWAKVPAFMGLTSWAGFVVGEKPGVEAMVMGDIVLFEDEVLTVFDIGSQVLSQSTTSIQETTRTRWPSTPRPTASTSR